MGDWLLLDRETGRARRLLRRRSLFKRRAAGTGRKLQLIAIGYQAMQKEYANKQKALEEKAKAYGTRANAPRVTPAATVSWGSRPRSWRARTSCSWTALG